jgi:glycosyltransferase involved in cell wall biosynthesis
VTSISIITPTIGRKSLRPMLQRVLPQLIEGDEVLIIGDGPQPVAKVIVDELKHPLIRYWESESIKNYGNPQRNMAIEQAKGDYLLFVDDDDLPSPQAFSVIRNVAKEFPGKPLMFKMMHCGWELWNHPRVEQGNISGQMFVTPNVKGKVGKWSGRYEADFDFVASTLKLYEEGFGAVVWRPENICIQGFVGRQAGAVEL